MELVSVIVPIYNAEKVLRRCLEGLKLQTYSELEILLIDDGSNDASATICKLYCEQDSHFRYVYQENRGNAAACNRGIKESRGDIIGFCDSDDWMDAGFIQDLVAALQRENADIAIGGYQISDGKTVYGSRIADFSGRLSQTELAEKFWELQSSYLLNTVWNKLYRRSVIQTFMDESMTCGQDFFFNMMNFMNAGSFAVSKTAEYYYYFPNDGVVKYPKNDARQCDIFSSSVYRFLERCLPKKQFLPEFKRFLCGNVCRDVGMLAKGKPYKTAKKMIGEFYDYPAFVEVIDDETWKQLSINYQIVGMLLKKRMLSAIILGAKLKGHTW